MTETVEGTPEPQSGTGKSEPQSDKPGESTATDTSSNAVNAADIQELKDQMTAITRENKRLKGVLAKVEPNADTLKAELDAIKAEREAEQEEARKRYKAALAESQELKDQMEATAAAQLAESRRHAIERELGLADPRVSRIALEEIQAAAEKDSLDLGDEEVLAGAIRDWAEKEDNVSFIGRVASSGNTPFGRTKSRGGARPGDHLRAVANDPSASRIERETASKWGRVLARRSK